MLGEPQGLNQSFGNAYTVISQALVLKREKAEISLNGCKIVFDKHSLQCIWNADLKILEIVLFMVLGQKTLITFHSN